MPQHTLKPHEAKPLSDTSPEALKMLDEAYRRMPMSERWKLVWQMHEQSRQLFAAGVRMREPDATDERVNDLWLQETLEPKVYSDYREHVRRTS